MQPLKDLSRRSLLRWTALTGAGFAVGMSSVHGGGTPPAGQASGKDEEQVSPGEDLMREHGVLNRVLLIYEEIIHRLDRRADFDPRVLDKSSGIIRNFIEDYHEKLEEQYLFPRFEKAGKLVELVSVLRAQHLAGREVTERIRQFLSPSALKDVADRRRAAGLLAEFIRMYRPHEAREDTVLFPAFHTVVSPHEYAALGEEFEDREHQLFGEDGFEKMVEEVGTMEKELGIYDLVQFTPHRARTQ